MSGEASGQNPTEIRYDTDDSALRRRSVELVRSAEGRNVRWTVKLQLAGNHHEVFFDGLKSRPADLPAAVRRHLAGIAGGQALEAESVSSVTDTDDDGGRPADTADAQTALAAILRSQLDQLLVHDLAVRLGLPDAVHRLRVSCRSLRALLKAAAPFLERSRTTDLDVQLRDLARKGAPARDFEVIAGLLPGSVELLDGTLQSEALEQLQGRALEQFTVAAQDVRRHLERREHLRLLADIQVFVSSPPYKGKVAGLSSRQLANKLLRRSLRRLQRIAAQSWESRDTLPAEEAALHHAHDVRKAVKRVRYVASMLDAAQVRPQKRLRKAAKDARRYQRELGDLMDSAILLEWLSRTAVDLDGEADRYAVGLLRGATATRVSQALRHAEVLIHELREQRVKS